MRCDSLQCAIMPIRLPHVHILHIVDLVVRQSAPVKEQANPSSKYRGEVVLVMFFG